jgi:hypothetical protein
MRAKPVAGDRGKEESGEPGALGARVRVPCATEAGGLVGPGVRSRGLSGNSDHSFVGSVRGALRPVSASAGPAAITCRQQARTKASRRHLTELSVNGSSPAFRQASAGPVGGCPRCEA